ncbi:MAG: leucyl aminopeptidase family protein [Arenimonas sp.]
MSLPACFVAASASTGATPLLVLDRASYPAWRETQAPEVLAWLDASAFTPAACSHALVPGADGRPRCVVAAIGDPGDPLALAHLAQLLPPGDYRLDPASPRRVDPGCALLGWGLGAYRFDKYLAPTRPPPRLVLEGDPSGDGSEFALLHASLLVRDLVNTPTEHMGPDQLEAVAARLAQAYSGRLKVIAGDELLAQNFPTIHAVGRASHRAPRLIELNWGDAAHPSVVICGKGVCFDTGGLDIKGHDGMRNMKKDMGGAAHALALAQLVMSLGLPIRLTVLVPAVENAIAGNAFRPGEVIVTRKGLSVEVDNTDAEGRLVLCDALAYGSERQPDLIMDFATLTGAARVAMGPDVPALFCNDDGMAAELLAAGERARDQLWRMPLWRPYLSYLKSPIADLSNGSPSRMAGAIIAALYLERFVPEGQRWAHLDMYAWNDNDRPGKPFGGEAQGLRAVLAFLQSRYG